MAKLSLELAQRLIAEARKVAGDKPIVVAVVDVGGDLVAFEKMDKTGRTMGRVAIGKAYTAAISGRETAVMAAKAKKIRFFGRAWRPRIRARSSLREVVPHWFTAGRYRGPLE